MTSGLEFRILGPLEARAGNEPLALGAAKQRALLAALLLHRGEVVSTDRLMADLWGERPPATARKALQVYVSGLRKALGDGVLETHGRGYRLIVEPGGLDLDRFEALLAEARASDSARAARLLREALALWRGPPLADLAYEPFAAGEIVRLEELRLTALEERAGADLAGGAGPELVPELDALVREHPLREGLRARLMVALYRAGRQADALECYQEGRRLLDDELGLQPGDELQELQQEILRHDPALGAPRRVPPAAPRRRRAALLAGAGCALLAVAAIAAVALLGGDDGAGAGAVLGRDVVGAIDPADGSVAEQVRVPGAPARLVGAGGALWVGADDARTLTSIDRRRRAVARVVAPPGVPSDLAAGERRVWAVDRERGAVVAVRPALGTVERRIALGGGAPFLNDRSIVDPWAIAVGAGRVWVTDGTRRLVEVDPRRGRVARRIDAGAPLGGVVVARGAVWAISGPRASVVRVDPRTGSVTDRISLVSRPAAESPYPIQIDAGAGALWVLNANTGTVSRIDPALRGVTASVAVGLEHTPLRLSAARDAVWVAARDGTLSRIDGRTNAVRATTVAHSLLDVAAIGDRVWVAAGAGPGANAGAGLATGAAGRLRALPSSSCSPVYHAPGAVPRYLIVANLPLQGAFGFLGAQMSQATLFYLREHGFRAGRFALGLQVCDHGTPTLPVLPRRDRCEATATAIARDPSVIGVVGPFTSGCAAVQLPILNRAPEGPVAMVSPTNTVVGLTRAGPSTKPGEPRRYQPTGRRGYARVIATDDVQATADAMIARALGLRRVYVLRDHDAYSRLVAGIFARAAPLVGVRVAGRGLVDEPGRALAARLRRARADGVFVGGLLEPSSGPLVRALRGALEPGVRIITPDGFLDPRLPHLVGRAAEAMTVSVPGVPLSGLPPRGLAFVHRFGRALGATPNDYAVYTAQATQVLADAIARSDGTRASVSRELFATHLRDGILGRFAITPAGDTTQTTVAVYGYAGGTQRLFRTVSPPADLLRRVRGERP